MKDAEFLELIQQDPKDRTNKLVYADYLEEQGAHEQAEFLRLVAIDGSQFTVEEVQQRNRRLAELQRRLHPEWLAAFDNTRVDNCPKTKIEFEFACPQRWEKMPITDEPTVRHCVLCDQDVYHCGSVEEAYAHARKNHCVAIDSRVFLDPGQVRSIANEPARMAGRIRPDPSTTVFNKGEHVQIASGNFANVSGVITGFANRRRQEAIVTVQHFGQEIELEIDVDRLKRLDAKLDPRLDTSSD